MAENLITRSAFAATMGVDRAQCTRWISAGMPVQSGGVDPAVAASWVRANIDPAQRNRRSIGSAEIAQAGVERQMDAADQLGRIALRLAIATVPAVARDSALDAGLTDEQAEAVYGAALKRAPNIEQPVKNAMEIPDNGSEPLNALSISAEIIRDSNGEPSLTFEQTRVARARADALEMANRHRAGDLVERATAEAVLFETSRAARDAWLNWPVVTGPLIATDLGVDAAKVTGLLVGHVHRQLAALGEPEADFAEGADV